MASPKNAEFSPELAQASKIARALAHPARLAILEFLLNQESCYCGAIVEALPLSQATVSQHLKELKEAGLIAGTIEGPRVCYCVDQKGWEMAREWFKVFFERNCCKGKSNCK